MPKTRTASELAEETRLLGDTGLLSADEKRELVQRVIDSQMFRRSFALRAFLLYVTEREISGQVGTLKEHTIGVEVLGRKPNYAPMSDNIVRVRAHDLRGRLERYFASEGANEPVVITIPVGSYAPSFERRKAIRPHIQEPALVAEPAHDINENDGRPRRFWLAFVVTALVVLSALVALGRHVISDKSTTVVRQTSAIQDFWSQFFDEPGEVLNVVYADPSFASWEDMNDKSLSLGDYLNKRYLDARNDRQRKDATPRTASSADIVIVGHLGALAGQFGGHLNVQFARDVNAEFFQHGNAVLLGSRRSNPWLELYERSLNFTLEVDPASGAPRFRNRSPRPGEAPLYAIPTKLDDSGVDETKYMRYGVAALLQGCGHRGLIVIAEGLSTQSTQAMGDMLTNPDRLQTLLKSIDHKPGTKVRPFEALIQITTFPNEYADPKVIAYRLEPADSCVGD